jgi:glycosyltransferase involved in cell wall biosynthesis
LTQVPTAVTIGPVTPLISVGLPVYNGERYLEGAIEALLAQDVDNFELLISDNASEDATAAIATAYAERDARVRYHRNRRNLGLAGNFNRLVELARGKYFKWAAHDDWHPPQTLRLCTEALEREPTAVLCGSAVAIMDEDGQVFDEWHPSVDLAAPTAPIRFHRLIWSMGETHPLFAVMRTDALRRTSLIQNYVGTDRVLLAQLVLMGPFLQLPEILHHYRQPRMLKAPPPPETTGAQVSVILNPANRGRLRFRTWRLCYEHLSVVARAPVAPWHKPWLAADVLARFGGRDSRRMAAEVYHAGRVLVSRARAGAA